MHPPNALKDNLPASAHLGSVDPATVKAKETGPLSEKERRRLEALENLPPLGTLLNLDDFEVRIPDYFQIASPRAAADNGRQKVARTILSDQAWAYYSSAGDDEVSEYHVRCKRTLLDSSRWC